MTAHSKGEANNITAYLVIDSYARLEVRQDEK